MHVAAQKELWATNDKPGRLSPTGPIRRILSVPDQWQTLTSWVTL